MLKHKTHLVDICSTDLQECSPWLANIVLPFSSEYDVIYAHLHKPFSRNMIGCFLAMILG